MTLLSSRGLGVRLALAVWALGAVGCSSGSGGLGLYGDGGTGDGGRAPTTDNSSTSGSTTTTDSSCTSKYPASQSLSEACCAERGADACGAGLFCAAFDGRTQTTCYAERSRADGQTCTENIQCEGNACNASGICKKPTTTTPPPPPGKCTPQCDVDADCQSTCPASGSSIACCDTVTAICYQSGAGTCPVH